MATADPRQMTFMAVLLSGIGDPSPTPILASVGKRVPAGDIDMALSFARARDVAARGAVVRALLGTGRLPNSSEELAAVFGLDEVAIYSADSIGPACRIWLLVVNAALPPRVAPS